ncbi:hypothetical protein [Shimia sp. Alg240-R146]|uniref:hypothetical protein n=1 Tax=Shimia sp. Alg240-R146 TaxID=2993449 RepID=UPI0022E6DDEE|nr:hypothetical protein [Shimia sp. Alg240-R146]
MRIFKPATALFALTFLTGCFSDGDVVPVNLDYAKTNYGYINSGDFKAGSFFLWDKGEHRMVHLSDVPGFEAPPNPRDKTVQVADYTSGASFGVGGQKAAIKAKADAMMSARSAFEISYPNSVVFDNTITRVTRYLGNDIRDGGGLLDEWGFRTAVNDPEQFYVLVRKVTYGDGIRLLVDGETEVNGGFSVIIKGADVNVRVQGKGLNAIQGTDTEVAFDVYVMRPFWKQTGAAQTPSFAVDHFVKIDGLPDLFRSTSRRDG